MQELKRQVNREIRKRLERKQIAVFEKRQSGRRDLDRLYVQLIDDVNALKQQERQREWKYCIIR